MLSPKQINHLGKTSSDSLLWSHLHCLCESYDKQAVGKLRNGLWNFPAVSSEWILHQLVQGKPSLSPPARRNGGLVTDPRFGCLSQGGGSIQDSRNPGFPPPGIHPPPRASSRASYTGEFILRGGFLCLHPQPQNIKAKNRRTSGCSQSSQSPPRHRCLLTVS